jgi:flagellar hook-associated protein 3 FlgL
MNSRLMTSAITRHKVVQHKLFREMSTGRKVELASDDPGAYEAIRNLKGDLARLKQFERNTNMANHYHSMADQGMERSISVLHRANELAVVAQDSTVDLATRGAIAEQVEELLQSMLSAANGQEGGRYTFAGLRTDVRPFQEEYDPVTGRISAVRYEGSAETRMIKIGPEMYTPTNIPGASDTGEGGIFQTATRDVFDSLIRLRDNLLGEHSAVDGQQIGEQLQADLDHMLAQTSLNGARHEQVRMQTNVLREAQVTSMESLASLESVDLAEASMRLAQADTSYQAALHSTATMMRQVSLLNYI